MTLDEAIEHAKEVASTRENKECAAEHEQLANWLTDLRMHRESKLTVGGMASGNDIHGGEEGSMCPTTHASVIYEGQKLTFDQEDSEAFARLIERHFRKLAGLEVEE